MIIKSKHAWKKGVSDQRIGGRLFLPYIQRTRRLEPCGSIWVHRKKRNEFLGRSIKKLDKACSKNVDQVKISTIISDIHNFLNTESNYQTNQELIGLRNIVRGTSVQCWIGDNFNNNDDRKFNKVITKESVLFYSECWIDRCKALHEEGKQRGCLKQWHNNVLNTM